MRILFENFRKSREFFLMITSPFYRMKTHLTGEKPVRPRQIFLIPSCMRVESLFFKFA